MTTELIVLIYTGLMTFFLVFIQGTQVPINFGFKWGLGNRDEPREPTAFMQRVARTIDNQLQALAIAVPFLVAVIVYPQAQTAITAIGAWLFLFGRIGFAICYLFGIPILRSVIWGVGMIGTLMIAYGVLVAM